ncbi:MAG: hypothetical protein AAGH15_10225 [Myxococcota bacterium]
MTTDTSQDARPGGATGNAFVRLVRDERNFIALIGIGFLAVGAVYQDAFMARWLGFALAGYSAVANDSIQTIGTFIAANKHRPWWALWIFIGGIFAATVIYSWTQYDGDVTYQRLASKGFETTPESFSFLQVAAPLFLMILTRLRMPVSTTFLLLTSFTTSSKGVTSVLTKSLSGYVVAFVCAIVVWTLVSKTLASYERRGPAHPGWSVAQWVTSGALWSVWIQQDAANIAVYLPRQLDVAELSVFVGVVVVGLGFLFKIGGERIQQVVDEKSSVQDVRSGTVINFVYAVILYIFKIESKVPMSTTWVFIGLLGGRELAMAFRGASGGTAKEALKLLGRDLLYTTIGLIVSLVIALAVNPGALGFD